MPKSIQDIIVIGGSAGSLPAILNIVDKLPDNFVTPVVIVLHRLRNVVSDMSRILSASQPNFKIHEPEDKERIKQKHIYIAPQNYHLLIEDDKTISLDYSEAVNYSRPSIDVTFESVAHVFADKTTAILLSGANADGAEGAAVIAKAGGTVIIQDPETSDYPAMPMAALEMVRGALVKTPDEIVDFIRQKC
ncbi:MAG: chemotaxis protein CheB [Filimonas sp.]|nr:chemotaxis protein CheB [Filimonas sp.]